MDLKNEVSKLIRMFNTRDPFIIARHLNIEILFADLGNYCGCYIYLKRHRCIIINNNLNSIQQKLVLAHELGHAVLHKKINCYFMRNKTLLNTSIYEREANIFAAYLLISDEDINECTTISQLSSLTGTPEELVTLILK